MKLDGEVVGISALSVILSMALFLGLAAAMFFFPDTFFTRTPTAQFAFEGTPTATLYVAGITIMLLSYIITNFFAGAISHSAFRRFEGNDPTFSESVGAAAKRLPALINFSGLQAVVGTVLNAIEERVPLAGKIAVWLTGAAWSIATMFAIPYIMDKNENNPLKVVRGSAKIFTAIWAESVFIGLSLGMIAIVASLLILGLIVGFTWAAVALSSTVIGVVGTLIIAVLILSLIVVTSTLQSIVMTAAYYYATRNKLPAGFDEELVRSMFRPKKSWLRG
jgi:hypothetical protein